MCDYMATGIQSWNCLVVNVGLCFAVRPAYVFQNHVIKVHKQQCQSRDLVLAVQSTGDLGCVYACVKNRFLFRFWVYSHN